jgi:hypothetical protein
VIYEKRFSSVEAEKIGTTDEMIGLMPLIRPLSGFSALSAISPSAPSRRSGVGICPPEDRGSIFTSYSPPQKIRVNSRNFSILGAFRGRGYFFSQRVQFIRAISCFNPWQQFPQFKLFLSPE